MKRSMSQRVGLRARHDQRGFTIASFALFLGVLMGMAALAVDVGVLYTARTSAQHAADAAALAGAMAFVDGTPPAQLAALATNSAIAMAAQNKVMGRTVTINAGNVAVDLANQTVTVTVPQTGANSIATFFARVLGINSVDIQTKATAQAWSAGAATSCLKPIFLPNTILSSLDPTAACNAGQVLFTPGSDQLSPWGGSAVPSGLQNIRPTNPSSALAPSQFYSLDFGSGGSAYRCALGQCLNACGITNITCGQSFPVETGNMTGPTQQGVNDLLDSPPDTFIAAGQYGTPAGVASTSRQLVVAPVWDNCTQTITSGKNSQNATIVGFVTAFVSGMQGQFVQAYVVGRTACAGSGGGSTGSATGPYGIPVRLVQNP